MRVEALDIPEVKLITTDRLYDHRGFFSETYNRNSFAEIGIEASFVQDNHSYSAAQGVVRGLHFQVAPYAQGKLVRVISGAIFDVAVDIRPRSASYGQHVSATISAENWRQIWIPEGFAHGFCTLEPGTTVLYKTTAIYAAAFNRGIKWDDPALEIAWPVDPEIAVLSEADKTYPPLAHLTEGVT